MIVQRESIGSPREDDWTRLCFTRGSGQQFFLETSDGRIVVKATIVSRQVRLVVEAPRSVKIVRAELERN